MKNNYLGFGTIGAGTILIGALYLNTASPEHEPVKLVKVVTTNRTRETLSPSQAIEKQGVYNTLSGNIGSTLESMEECLNKDPVLKRRVQGMSWYRDYLTGKLSKEIVDQYISDAFLIEQFLITNPGIFEKIQYEGWWQRYTRGDTNPTEMLAGNISATIELQKIEQEQPDLYNRARKSPLWNKGIQLGEDYVVVGQRELLTSLGLRLDQLDANPELEKQLLKLGYTRHNLVTDDWSQGQGIYGVIDVLREIDALGPEAKEKFFASDIWKNYLAGNIRIQDIENSLHGQN